MPLDFNKKDSDISYYLEFDSDINRLNNCRQYLTSMRNLVFINFSKYLHKKDVLWNKIKTKDLKNRLIGDLYINMCIIYSSFSL